MQKPSSNFGSYALSDFDGDGDIDLFIGASNWVNYYGIDPTSVLLINSLDASLSVLKLAA